jgi:NADH-quinone oxidoreductase subunit L
MPPFSGWLSKDDIIGYLDHRGGGFEVLGILGYFGALMTGLYTFRMIFRAFWGDPCPEAVELEHGHIAHAEVPRNPATGEAEDTDVGFPGPEHHIAERELPMKVAMGSLAVLTVGGGVLAIPGVDNVIKNFLAPTFADSRLAKLEPHVFPEWLGLVIGAVIAVSAITLAYRVWILQPETAPRLRERFAPLHAFLVNKWYFDEAIDYAIVRPSLMLGRVAESVGEKIVIGGAVTGGVVGVVRGCSAIVRRAQTGIMRFYAAAMIVGLAFVAFYVLLSAS